MQLRARHGRATVVIAPDSPGDTAGDLARALGIDAIEIDGREVPPACPLAVSGLLDGSTIRAPRRGWAWPAMPPPPPAAAPRWRVEVVAGPDSGHSVVLGDDGGIIGRSPTATLRIDDPAIEPHHLAVSTDGVRPHVVHLAASTVAAAGDDPPDHTSLTIGHSRVELRPSTERDASRPVAAPPAIPDLAIPVVRRGPHVSPWQRTHHRPLRPPAVPLPPPITLPAAPPATSARSVPAGLLPTVLGAIATGVVAMVMHQPLLMLFGAAALLAATGTWGAQHLSRARQRRAERAAAIAGVEQLAAAVAAQRAADADHERRHTPDVCTAIRRIETSAPQLWERRPHHGDSWQVVLGRGERTWEPRVDGELPARGGDLAAVLGRFVTIDDVPTIADLGPGSVTGVAGPAAAGVVRAMVLQLAANCGPADWRMVVVTERADDWTWTSWLPQGSTVQTAALLDPATFADVERHTIVIVDGTDALASRTSPLRRHLTTSERPPAVVAIAGTAAELPGFCTAVLTSTAEHRGRWYRDPSEPELPVPVHLAAVTPAVATAAAARLAHRRDPELDAAAAGLQAEVSVLGDLAVPETAQAVAAGWDRRGADPAPTAVIGRAADGVIEIDLSRDGPHALIGGTTGAGKSELLRTLLIGLALASPPELMSFVLIDYKGGAAFDACAALPHVAGVVTDLDEHLAARALRSLDAELRRRERFLREHGAADLASLRAGSSSRERLARLVVVVDEFATLAADLPGFMTSLVAIAQRGRSLGVHLVLATQRPGTAINDDIRANTNLRLALRVQDAVEAIDVVGDRTPAGFPRHQPGRAMLRLGHDELVVFQVATTCGPPPPEGVAGLHVHKPDGEGSAPPCDGAAPTQLDVLVQRIVEAAGASRHAPRVWAPVLPDRIGTDALAAVDRDDPNTVDDGEPCVGVADDPDHQSRRALRWARRDGHLLVVGALGSGTTSAAITVARSVAAHHAPADLHLYAIDGRGDHRLAEVAALPHCAGVINVADSERLERLVRRLFDDVQRRRALDHREPAVVLLVDGLPAVRAALEGLRGDVADWFDGIIADGPAVGITALVTTDQPFVPLGLTAGAPQRWVMRLADPTSAALLDVGVSEAMPASAPPGRLLAIPQHLEAQLVDPAEACRWEPIPGTGPQPVLALPTEVDPAQAGVPARRHHVTALPLGLAARDLRPVGIELADGEHIAVLGTPRSGRSTALHHVATCWQAAHPDGKVAVVHPRRSPLAMHGWAEAGPLAAFARDVAETKQRRVLLAIDDAELVDDPALQQLATMPNVTIAIASRADALRQLYGHWTQLVRRSRTGVVFGRGAETDGDVLGVLLPRRWPVPWSPGRGWLIQDGACIDVVQIAQVGSN